MGWRSLFPKHIIFSKGLEKKLAATYECISKASTIYNNHLFLSFNGGKDATVIFDLCLRYIKYEAPEIKIDSFYINTGGEFQEVYDFLAIAEEYWNVRIIKLDANSLKDGLTQLIDEYKAEAVILGVRKVDPRSPMNEFEETTQGWPHAMRVMPILNWEYNEIWEYLDKLSVPVCSLYEKGYSSIGAPSKTTKNPLLFDQITKKYLHARHLKSLGDERKGRDAITILTNGYLSQSTMLA